VPSGRRGSRRKVRSLSPSPPATTVLGAFPTIGSLIRHIFSSELRYAERIAGLPLTDTTVVATDDSAALFLLGAAGRQGFIRVIETIPAARWTVAVGVSFAGFHRAIDPSKGRAARSCS
jgi:hypothetical protein